MKEIYLAGGCFWGTQKFVDQFDGVLETTVGYANGKTERPSYEDVCHRDTGHAETVRIRYDETVLPTQTLLRYYFMTIDPTSVNRQGNDIGTQYRTGIYYTDEADVPTIEKVYAEEQSKYAQPLAVEKLPLLNFYPANEYHQDYLDKHPDGYCHLPMELFRWAKEQRMS